MERELIEELDQLKKEYLEAERLFSDEKACLMRVINVFGTLVGMHDAFSKELLAIKKLLKTDKPLPLDQIMKGTEELRSKIFSSELEKGVNEDPHDSQDDMYERLVNACRIIKRIMVPFLDGFYPLNSVLVERTKVIRLTCNAEMAESDLEEAANAFLGFAKELKGKISEDFKYINSTFLNLLEQVKDLESMLTSEFGDGTRIKELEYFEMKINKEVGAIVNSFDIHRTINEIKSAVVTKLKNIKHLVAKKRKEEMKWTEMTREKVDKLKKRVVETEKEALKMSKRAEQFQAAATRDGLTGLYNRGAFDLKLKGNLKRLNEVGTPFALVLFDVDGFKWINDTFGHVAGDKVLKIVAQVLRETFRKGDFLSRYGGDEFAAIIEEMSEEMAHQRVAKFIESFRMTRFFSHMMKKDIRLSVSSGIVLAEPGDTAESLIHKTDMAMYSKKIKEKAQKEQTPIRPGQDIME
ncbi:MAG: diguanylate cyclase [Pseudomonadota bacterium]